MGASAAYKDAGGRQSHIIAGSGAGVVACDRQLVPGRKGYFVKIGDEFSPGVDLHCAVCSKGETLQIFDRFPSFQASHQLTEHAFPFAMNKVIKLRIAF